MLFVTVSQYGYMSSVNFIRGESRQSSHRRRLLVSDMAATCLSLLLTDLFVHLWRLHSCSDLENLLISQSPSVDLKRVRDVKHSFFIVPGSIVRILAEQGFSLISNIYTSRPRSKYVSHIWRGIRTAHLCRSGWQTEHDDN